jgi:tRNA (cytidine/uridine-2'-O-)-methyltransferase
MPVELALYQPEIAQNTGTILRLCTCLDLPLHIIHPTGFPFSPKRLKSGLLDYFDKTTIREHDSYADFACWVASSARRLVLLTTKATVSVYSSSFAANDVLLMGRESSGVPPDVAADAAVRLRIPMRSGLRSINVAVSAAMVLGEALRQTHHFESLV